MRSTLFVIPAELAGVPVFGIGWLLLAWVIVSVIGLLILARRQGWNRDTAGSIPFLLIVAAAIAFVLPMLVENSPGGVRGIPVRGFGVMFMLAAIAGVGLAAYRAQQIGMDPEIIISLSFTMLLAGIIGARVFYVVQYWHEFARPSFAETLQALANFTKGGLVVYGAVLFGLPAGIWFLHQRKLPILPMADLIAPSMALGQAIGRVGCFLNGCCYGGVCLASSLGMTFPAGSPPYEQHVQQYGWHSGVWLEEQNGAVRIGYVAPGGAAESAGLIAGQTVTYIGGSKVESLVQARDLLRESRKAFEIELADESVHRWSIETTPARSVPIHATQIYAAIDAGLLALLLWAYYPFRRRDGEVFAILVTLHPISRFLLEVIRNDEPGRFGTELTIAQWISIAILAAAGVLWWYIERQRPLSPVPGHMQVPATGDN